LRANEMAKRKITIGKIVSSIVNGKYIEGKVIYIVITGNKKVYNVFDDLEGDNGKTFPIPESDLMLKSDYDKKSYMGDWSRAVSRPYRRSRENDEDDEYVIKKHRN
jgi:hypothetical protein